MDRYRLDFLEIRKAIKQKRMSAQFIGFLGHEPADGAEDAILQFTG